MRICLLLSVALISVASLMLQVTVHGQAPTNPEVSPINPETKCNATPPSLKRDKSSDPRVDTPVTTALLSSGLPCTPTFVSPFDLENLQHGFDFYSWLTFLALSAPADDSLIGKTDRPSKWEAWKQLPDVMLPDASEPSAWQPNNIIIPAACEALRGPDKIVIHMEEETFNQPFKTGPLIDQNSHYALFAILMNEPMFNYVRENKLYSAEGQRNFRRGQERFNGSTSPAGEVTDPVVPDAGVVNFPNGKTVGSGNSATGTVGSIMVKAAWKIMDKSDDPAMFHIAKGLIFTPAEGEKNATCIEKTLGLVGLHIVHKTVDAHQWIWSTFEHVNNVPTQEEASKKLIRKGTRYNFFDPNCMKNCKPNQTPPQPWHPTMQMSADGFTFRDHFKSQITRVVPVTRDVETTLNSKFREALKGTVWANYMLISTQWPSLRPCSQSSNTRNEPDPTCAPVPTFLANTTLETYSQGTTPLASSSCIACHGNATSLHRPATPSDFTFILEKAH